MRLSKGEWNMGMRLSKGMGVGPPRKRKGVLPCVLADMQIIPSIPTYILACVSVRGLGYSERVPCPQQRVTASAHACTSRPQADAAARVRPSGRLLCSGEIIPADLCSDRRVTFPAVPRSLESGNLAGDGACSGPGPRGPGPGVSPRPRRCLKDICRWQDWY